MAEIGFVAAPHSQSQSPFFNALPPEIRNEIYSWTLLQSEDASQTYEADSYWSRPGFRAPLKSRPQLLHTCRLVHLEAETFLMRKAEHAFWFDRGPQEQSGIRKCWEFFNALTPKDVQDLVAVRFFTQMYWLEGHHMNQLRHSETASTAPQTEIQFANIVCPSVDFHLADLPS